MAWLYLIIAALFEMMWTISMKELNGFRDFSLDNGWAGFLYGFRLKMFPLVSYVLAGFFNFVFLSKATAPKMISLSVAIPVWMGVSVVGVILVETFYYKVKFNPVNIIFIGLIAAGVVGLHLMQDNGNNSH